MDEFDLERIKKLHHGSNEFIEFCYMLVDRYGDNLQVLDEYAKELNTSVSLIRKLATKYKSDDKYFNYSQNF